MKCLKKFFSPAHTPIKEHGQDGYLNPVWGVIIGHTKKAQGAISHDKKYTEYMYGAIAAPEINVPWETRDKGGVFGAASTLIKNYSINCLIEIHGNAFNSRAEGYEILIIKGDALSRKYAENFLLAFKKKYPDRVYRGVKEIAHGGRGYNNLVAMKRAGAKVALLTEIFFIDNASDWLAPIEQGKFWREQLSAEAF